MTSIVDGEKLDLRIWVDSNNYKGWTKQGLRFYPFDGNWPEFKKLIDKVDKVYEEIVLGGKERENEVRGGKNHG